tara:strand:- start:32 stop:535 length:504 start_codon:yes stop_codon:yes gene_type:complete
MEFELILIFGTLSVILGIIVAILIVSYKKQQQNVLNLKLQLEQKQKQAYQMGTNATTGNYHQILGDFAFLSKYDQLITLSTTSKQPSLDLIGVNEESLDFIEIKKVKPNGKLNRTSDDEDHVRRLIEEKKVSYKVFDVDLPDNFTIEERKLKALKDKSQKDSSKKSQ